jgi:hypothetical protein
MNYIHAITRKQTPSEVDSLSELKQKEIILEYLTNQMGFELDKVDGVDRISNSSEYELSWKTDYRGSGNSKFGEAILGINLFKSGVPQSESHLHDGRTLRFETGDILITAKYPILFGDHPKHILEIVGNVIRYYKGKFILCDLGEITQTNKQGEILFSILNTMSNIRFEKSREMNLKTKRTSKQKDQFLGGARTPFGKDWKSYADGTLSKLTPQDRKVLLQGKPKFGYYINANGVLVPNKLEQEAIKMMRSLRKRRFSYVKIAKRIGEHFGTNKKTEEPNIKISHTGVYRIINPTRKATTRKETTHM